MRDANFVRTHSLFAFTHIVYYFGTPVEIRFIIRLNVISGVGCDVNTHFVE